MREQCSIKGCPNEESARGWCRTHYYRWYRHDDPLFDARKYRRTAPPVPKPNGSHGVSRQPLYGNYKNMMARCYNRNNKSFHRYGGRGIKVWAPWKDNPAVYVHWVETFLGPCPEPGMSIDRIDNNGDYEPGNLRWATAAQQCANREISKHKRQHAHTGTGL